MPKLDLDGIEQTNRTGYPQPWAAEMGKRLYRRLAPAASLTDFGASHVVLQPGGISSQRHWHEGEETNWWWSWRVRWCWSRTGPRR